jgi:ADP-glucose pyrophosphorylase
MKRGQRHRVVFQARVEPLTRDRSKPAVPFGGKYRAGTFPSECTTAAFANSIS